MTFSFAHQSCISERFDLTDGYWDKAGFITLGFTGWYYIQQREAELDNSTGGSPFKIDPDSIFGNFLGQSGSSFEPWLSYLPTRPLHSLIRTVPVFKRQVLIP